MKKIALLYAMLAFSLEALEFGSMGNTPASVGGAGVAYKKNEWAMYYNPALLGVNRKANIAYSFGVGYADNNVAELTSIDINALKDLPSDIQGIFQTKGKSRVARDTSNVNNIFGQDGQLGVFGQVIGNLGSGGIKNEQDLAGYICKKTNNCSNGADKDLSQAIGSIGNSGEIFDSIKKDLEDAIDKTKGNNPGNVGLDILDSIIGNLNGDDVENLFNAIEKCSSPNGTNGTCNADEMLKDFLKGFGENGISITKGSVAAIDALSTIIDTVNQNSLSIHSNNGFVFHIAGDKNRGAIGMGIMMNAYAFAGIELDKTHNRIIVEINNGTYIEVANNGNKVTLKSGSLTTDDYNNYSILSGSANHMLHANGLALTEIPLSYGHTIPLFAGDLHLGGSIKYIYALSMNNSQKFNFNDINLNFNLNDNLKETHTFGVDLGALYTIDWFAVGVVGKNLNAPTIKTSAGKYRIMPQFRAGVSAEVWRFTFLADIDLYPNDTLQPGVKNQMVGGGVILDATWLDFRFGAMGDMRKNPYGVILTGGINFFHFLDLSVQSSLKTVDIGGSGLKLPNYFDVRFGGRFQW